VEFVLPSIFLLMSKWNHGICWYKMGYLNPVMLAISHSEWSACFASNCLFLS
jgi:hypothetical protein